MSGGAAVSADVAGDGQRAERPPALGMHHPLGDALAVLMRQLFEQLVVLHQHRTARAGGFAVLVVGNRRAGGRRETCHVSLPPHLILLDYGPFLE